MKRLMVACALLAALAVGGASTADAHWRGRGISIQIGRPYYGVGYSVGYAPRYYGGHYHSYPSYSGGYYNSYPSYGYYGGSYYGGGYYSGGYYGGCGW